jgi:4-alpha-glucanotransferase
LIIYLISAFGGGADNPHLPHNHEVNQVVYSGTHDNDTIRGWWDTLDQEEKSKVISLISIPLGFCFFPQFLIVRYSQWQYPRVAGNEIPVDSWRRRYIMVSHPSCILFNRSNRNHTDARHSRTWKFCQDEHSSH